MQRVVAQLQTGDRCACRGVGAERYARAE
jgi:hypothetical protein